MKAAFLVIFCCVLVTALGADQPPPTVLKATWDECPTGPVQGYRVAVGTKSGVYDWKVDVGNRTACALILPSGQYYVVVTAYQGILESRQSNEVQTSVP